MDDYDEDAEAPKQNDDDDVEIRLVRSGMSDKQAEQYMDDHAG